MNHYGHFERQQDGNFSITIHSIHGKPSMVLSAESFFGWFPHVSRRASLGCDDIPQALVLAHYGLAEVSA